MALERGLQGNGWPAGWRREAPWGWLPLKNAGLAEVLAAGAGWGGWHTHRRWLRAAGQAERLSVAVVLVAGRGSGSWAGLRWLRFQVAGLASGSWAGWRLRLEASGDLLMTPGVLVLVLTTISPGRASRGSLSVLHLGGDWLLLPQALPYMCLAVPGPCAVVPARMPQARPCRPMRSGRQGERWRCRHAWLHTPPSRPAGGLGLPGCAVPGAEAVERGVRGERRWEASVGSLASC